MKYNMNSKFDLTILGHAFRRRFSYVEDGAYKEVMTPGGAALIQQILSQQGLTSYEPLPDSFRCEYYADSRPIGITEGVFDMPSPDSAAPYALVWDEGLGAISSVSVPTLWASNKALPDKETFEKIAKQCFLMLDADVLRKNGAMISKAISWERSATELIWQLENNPALSHLRLAPHTLITFAEDAAVYIRRKGANLTATIVLTHSGGENFLRDKIKGRIPDTFAVMVAAAALQFPNVIEEKQVLQILPILKSAEKLLTDEKDEIFQQEDVPYTIPYKHGQDGIDPNFWRISDCVGNKGIFDIAKEYVLTGAKVIQSLPQLSFGKLTTIDRQEIEAFRNISNLISEYDKQDNVQPLSIAVFGAPGSGKSFGVKQIAKNILPKEKMDILEFNVSQFTSNANFTSAFHKVRDVVLEGKLPLVFFDEFDSDNLEWLKKFLMPMQDGKFTDENGEHPIGKCILVFAGGTASTFAEFTQPKNEEDFKKVKGPDFVSRLRGFINVLGPNKVGWHKSTLGQKNHPPQTSILKFYVIDNQSYKI
jgi:hypothetical protein